MVEQCTLCNGDYDLEEYTPNLDIPKLMAEHKICYECAFWLHRKRLDERAEGILPLVIDGSHYTVQVDKEYQSIIGKQDKFVYLHNLIITSSGRIIPVNLFALWHQGTIPERFRDLFPNNAVRVEDPVLVKELRSGRKVDKNLLKNLFKNFVE